MPYSYAPQCTYTPASQGETGRSDLRGGVTSETVGQPFTTLQLGSAPAADECYPAVEANNVVDPVVVHTSGSVVVNAGNNGFLSLENQRICTSSTGWTALSLQNGWHQGGGRSAVVVSEQRPPRAARRSQRRYHGPGPRPAVAQRAPGCRRAVRRRHREQRHRHARLHSNGQIVLHAGSSGLLARDGVRIPLAKVTTTTALTLQNGWHQAAGVDPVGVSADGTRFATLSGGANGGTVGQVVATLPSSFAPASDVWFSVVTANDVVDPLVVHPNGDIVLNAGNPGFLSLAGLRIPTS